VTPIPTPHPIVAKGVMYVPAANRAVAFSRSQGRKSGSIELRGRTLASSVCCARTEILSWSARSRMTSLKKPDQRIPTAFTISMDDSCNSRPPNP
jgi:hypothetical protein